MAYDYDKLYGSTPDALGDPTPEIVTFFDRYDVKNARILDLGCGQGKARCIVSAPIDVAAFTSEHL